MRLHSEVVPSRRMRSTDFPPADWYFSSGRKAERWECLAREAGGPYRRLWELLSAPPLVSKPGLFGVAEAAERFRSL